MKLRLPSLLVQALLTTCAAALTTTATADVPEDYTQVVISNANDLNQYSTSSGYAFLINADINSTTRMSGAYQYWCGSVKSEQHILTFANMSSSYGAAIECTHMTMEEFKELDFTNCKGSSGSANGGGAIYDGANREEITISNNGIVNFSSNHAYVGGAIQSYASTYFIDNQELIFSDNYATSNYSEGSKGGAIVTSNLSILGNESVSFKKNYVSSARRTYGGAIYGSGNLNISGNQDVVFTENHTATTYTSTYSTYSYGGAIYGETKSEVNLSGNKSILFKGNYAQASVSSNNYTVYSYGGAIYAGTNSEIVIRCNDSIAFNGNYVYSSSYKVSNNFAYGGAIYGDANSNIYIEGNDAVEFRGNWERCGSDHYRLRSLYTVGGSLKLSAGEGQKITFYDSIYAGDSVMVTFNDVYLDNDAYKQKGLGEIIMSGLYTEEDMAAIYKDYYSSDLQNSRTFEIYSLAQLNGGYLRIEDKAVYKGCGITTAANSNATLYLTNGTLEHTGYKVTMNTGTTLHAQKTNSVTASSLEMLEGSKITFTLGDMNQNAAAIKLSGDFIQEGDLTLNLLDDGTMQQEKNYALLKLSSGKNPISWDSSKITVLGLDAEVSDLNWESGTLYFTYRYIPILTTATWNGAQSAKWNTTDKNWVQGEIEYRYKDGVNVVFGDAASGEIELEGDLAPMSVQVANSSNHEYAFAGNGCLTGDMQLIKAGAGKLTIGTANDYAGGTVILAGEVLVNNDEALGSGGITLSSGKLDLNSHTIANNLSLGKAQEYSSAEIGGGTITGDIDLSYTTLHITDDLSLSGQITAITESVIEVDDSRAVTIYNTIVNNEYIVLSGIFDISNIEKQISKEEYIGGDCADNGFLKVKRSAAVLYNRPDADFDWREAEFIHNGETATKEVNGIVAMEETDYGIFYVNAGKERVGKALDGASAASENLNLVQLEDGVTLEVDRNISTTLLSVVEGGQANLLVNGGVCLTADETPESVFTISGTGTHKLKDGSTVLGLTLDAHEWMGTIQISHAAASLIDFNSYGNNISSVALEDVSGTLVKSKDMIFSPHIKLLGKGLTITNATSLDVYTFAGGVSGDGDLNYFLTGIQHKQTYIFTSDVSKWTGSFNSKVCNDGMVCTLKFYDNATEMGAAIKKTVGVVNVEVGDGTNLFATTFMNTVQATNFTVLEAATASFTAGTQIAEKLDSTGTMQIQGEGSISVGVAIEIRAAAEDAPGAMTSIIATTTQLNARGEEKAGLAGCYIDIKNNYTMEKVSISGTVIDVGAGKTLYVKHADIKADARITDEAAWLDMVDTHGWLDNTNTVAEEPVMSLGDTLFYRSSDDAWVRLDHDVSYVALTSELFSNVTMTGSDLWLDLRDLAGTIGNAQAFSIAFKDALYDVNGLRVIAMVDGEHYLDGYYTTKHDGTTTTLYFSSQIPEPGTCTLTLFALAALTARRRRK